jgi:hypothetical protein
MRCICSVEDNYISIKKAENCSKARDQFRGQTRPLFDAQNKFPAIHRNEMQSVSRTIIMPSLKKAETCWKTEDNYITPSIKQAENWGKVEVFRGQTRPRFEAQIILLPAIETRCIQRRVQLYHTIHWTGRELGKSRGHFRGQTRPLFEAQIIVLQAIETRYICSVEDNYHTIH